MGKTFSTLKKYDRLESKSQSPQVEKARLNFTTNYEAYKFFNTKLKKEEILKSDTLFAFLFDESLLPSLEEEDFDYIQSLDFTSLLQYLHTFKSLSYCDVMDYTIYHKHQQHSNPLYKHSLFLKCLEELNKKEEIQNIKQQILNVFNIIHIEHQYNETQVYNYIAKSTVPVNKSIPFIVCNQWRLMSKIVLDHTQAIGINVDSIDVDAIISSILPRHTINNKTYIYGKAAKYTSAKCFL